MTVLPQRRLQKQREKVNLRDGLQPSNGLSNLANASELDGLGFLHTTVTKSADLGSGGETW